MSLNLEEAQQIVDQWVQTIGVRYFDPLTNLGILMEETGELARLLVRKYGEQSFKGNESAADLADEMADVLWVLICLANQCDIDLSCAFKRNLEKKTKRDGSRHQENKKLK